MHDSVREMTIDRCICGMFYCVSSNFNFGFLNSREIRKFFVDSFTVYFSWKIYMLKIANDIFFRRFIAENLKRAVNKFYDMELWNLVKKYGAHLAIINICDIWLIYARCCWSLQIIFYYSDILTDISNIECILLKYSHILSVNHAMEKSML